ncbi:cytochrome c3 family protein [bacterium]|nr:cytochrome c3 family protein [bacterium]
MKYRTKILTAFFFLSIPYAIAASPKNPDQCFVCHESMGDKPASLYKSDVHNLNGISCSGCHGGDASKEDQDEAMKKSMGFIGVPRGDEISKLCANCHADSLRMSRYNSTLPTHQMELLTASVHGKNAIKGGQHIVQCVTCHGTHGIASVKNPKSPVHPLRVIQTCTQCHANAAYMRLYNPSLPVDQLEKYRTSVHGIRNAQGDTKTAVCSSCHSGHDIQPAGSAKSHVNAALIPETCAKCHADAGYMKEYKIPTDQYEKFTKSVHGIALLQKHDLSAPACNDCHGNHGAVPPGVESISKVCGSCHALNADLFSASPHKKAFDENKFPECETCHGNHGIMTATVSMLGVDSAAVCSECHTEQKSVKGYKVAMEMRLLIDSLTNDQKRALGIVEEAEQKGMEIGEAKFKLRDAHQARLESRTMVHSFDKLKFDEVVNKGLNVTSFVSAEAHRAVEEYFFRRWGLGIATLIITVLAVSLYAYIRRLENK